MEIDFENRTAYLGLAKGVVARTVSPDYAGLMVNADLDAKGQVLGIELLWGMARPKRPTAAEIRRRALQAARKAALPKGAMR